MRCGVLIALGLWVAGTAGAVTDAEVERFVALSDNFYESLGNTVGRNASQGDKRRHARCVLEEFEARAGGGGLEQLLSLMAVVAQGVAFDDRTVVAFTESYGDDYSATVQKCRDT